MNKRIKEAEAVVSAETRKWFQEHASIPHYDVCKSKRLLAINKFGAIPVERHEFVMRMREIRAAMNASRSRERGE